MFLSAVPPPEASSPAWWGDHATALTAAVWSLKRQRGTVGSPWFSAQTKSLLSLPPLASIRSSGDHLRPQTSCLCAVSSLMTQGSGDEGRR